MTDRALRGWSLSVRLAVGLAVVCAGYGLGVGSAPVCGRVTLPPQVEIALAAVVEGVDPCGGSPEVVDLVKRFRNCAGEHCRVCISNDSERNFTDRGVPGSLGFPTTITWNPGLTTELERGCDGDPNSAVRRDPVASLVHEVVHAVQDCAGLDPTAGELEAVRIENIYRRAHHLCQRTRYGDTPLPTVMMVQCDPSHCSCASARAPVLEAAAIGTDPLVPAVPSPNSADAPNP